MKQPRTRSREGWLFEFSPEPVWLIRLSDLAILDLNEAACQRFGYEREQCGTLTLHDLLSDSDVARFSQAAALEDTASPELTGYKVKTSRGLFVDTDLSVRFARRRKELLALVTPLDMTGRKLLEERLRQAGKMESLGLLAGGIAHDFNNLLTIISGYGQLLMNGAPESSRGSIEQILKAAYGAAQLTGQLLTFSRRKELQTSTIDVNQLVSGMSTMLRRLIGEHIELRLDLEAAVGTIRGDPGQIEQVIMNLAVNARDAMADGGLLLLQTRRMEVGQGGAARPGNYVALSVGDTGTGIDDATVSHVFDPFFTTKESGKGTGLGLYTVHGIVARAGGTVQLRSKLGEGTTVEVLLPRVEMPDVPEALAPPAVASGGLETVLLVEDEDAVRNLVRTTLERSGYRVLVAPDGDVAIRIAHAEPAFIHLMITDMVMPRMSGLHVAQEMKVLRPEMRTLFISGYTGDAMQQSQRLPPGAEYLQKPFTPGALVQRVRSILDNYTRAAGG